MADRVILVEKVGNAPVEHLKELAGVDRGSLRSWGEQCWLRRDFDEFEATAQGEIDQRDVAIGGVHRADKVQVWRHENPRLLFGPRKLALEPDREFGAKPLVWLDRRDQRPEDTADVAPIDLVNHDYVLAAR